MDQSTGKMRGGHLRSNTAADKGVSVNVSEDVRQYPVAEEEEEEEEAEEEEEEEEEVEEGQQEHQEQEPQREDELHVVESSQVDNTSNSQREPQAEKHRKNEDEDEEAGRARIAKEWEAIDQVWEYSLSTTLRQRCHAAAQVAFFQRYVEDW